MSSTASESFIVGDLGDVHEPGNPECSECWTPPWPCEEPGCTGLIHNAFGDENYDGDYWLYERCDVHERNP